MTDYIIIIGLIDIILNMTLPLFIVASIFTPCFFLHLFLFRIPFIIVRKKKSFSTDLRTFVRFENCLCVCVCVSTINIKIKITQKSVLVDRLLNYKNVYIVWNRKARITNVKVRNKHNIKVEEGAFHFIFFSYPFSSSSSSFFLLLLLVARLYFIRVIEKINRVNSFDLTHNIICRRLQIRIFRDDWVIQIHTYNHEIIHIYY